MGQVTDHAAVADDGRETGASVDDGPVLNGGAGADGDGPVVAAKDGARPDTRFGADHHVADHDRFGVDEGVDINPRCNAVEFVDGHGGRRYTWAAIQVTPW